VWVFKKNKAGGVGGGGRKHLATCIVVSNRNARRLGRWFSQLLIDAIEDVRKQLAKGSLPG